MKIIDERLATKEIPVSTMKRGDCFNRCGGIYLFCGPEEGLQNVVRLDTGRIEIWEPHVPVQRVKATVVVADEHEANCRMTEEAET